MKDEINAFLFFFFLPPPTPTQTLTSRKPHAMNASVCSSVAEDLGRRELEESHNREEFQAPDCVSGLLGTTALLRAHV